MVASGSMKVRFAAATRFVRLMLSAGLMLALWAAATVAAEGPAGPAEPLDRYREWNLVLMVSEGADAAWAAHLGAGDEALSRHGPLVPPVPVASLQTPLNRIADPAATVADAARLFRFARSRESDLRDAIERFADEHPEAVMTLDPARLAEDALIIRSALAADIEYLGRDRPGWRGGLGRYQAKTVYLRNMMEFWTFDQELAALTEQALRETGTRIEAYQRLLEVDPRLDAFTHHLRAVEYVYREYGRKREDPDDPSDRLIDDASRVD